MGLPGIPTGTTVKPLNVEFEDCPRMTVDPSSGPSTIDVVPMSMTPGEFDKYLRGDIVKWAEVVKKFGDKP